MITYRFKAPTPRGETKWGGKLIVKGLSIPMTPGQRDVYLYVRFFWEKFGYAPSQTDIAHGLGLKSKSNIQRIVKRIVDNRVLSADKFKHRVVKPANVSLVRLLSRDARVGVEKRSDT